MARTKGPYCEEHPIGTLVRIAPRKTLEAFMLTWKFHNKLQREQLEHAGETGKITWFGFYHGGDELYQIEGIPGTWHEQCLEAPLQS